MSDQIAGLIGLFGGLLCALIGEWAGRRQLKKNRGIDERYEAIRLRSSSAGWWITMAFSVVWFTLVILGFIESAVAAIAVLYAVHVAGRAVAQFYYNVKM